MKISGHLFFWLFVTLLLTVIFGQSDTNYAQSFYFVCLLLPVIIGTTYFFNLVLVPRYLLHKKYRLFLLYTCYLIIISLNLEMLVTTAALMLLAQYNYTQMIPLTTNLFALTAILYLIVFVWGFIHLLRFYLQSQHNLAQTEKKLKREAMTVLMVKEKRQNKPISLSSISHLESLGDYVQIVNMSGEVTKTREKISHLAQRLPQHFIRVHRSFIVNQHHISAFGKEQVDMGKTTIPISRTYKKEVLAALNGTFAQTTEN